jgi:FixJ family two-component response regulator
MTKHILLIDDEVNFRYSAAIVLRKAGYKISEAESAEKALEMILDEEKRHEQFDLLLLDIQLPGMSGSELIDKLRMKSIFIPIFVISGYADSALVRELIKKGTEDFLRKPFEPEWLLKRVETIIKKKMKDFRYE